jgi:NAD(P)-dependent dehydrogenase (short-subunit alcohol dehydrogenase family)
MGVLEGRRAIVTGAGRGIGRGEARLLAAEGARVVVNDRGAALEGGGNDTAVAQEVVDEIVAAGGQAVANGDDVASWEGAQRLVQQAIEHFGQLDILVNNAGILRDRMSFNMDESDWDAVVNVHLKGHFAPTHFAALHWRQRAKRGEETVNGRIINTSSEAGLFGSAGQANYAACKGGIVSLTWVLARELGRYGVTANAIAPRARTRMTETMSGGFMDAKAGEFDEWDPANIAPVVAWLASDAAAGVNGQVFVVWGGQVSLVAPFSIASTIETSQRWTPALLAAQQDALFGERDRGVPTPPVV